MKSQKRNKIDRDIQDTAAKWKPPFGPESAVSAKLQVLNRIHRLESNTSSEAVEEAPKVLESTIVPVRSNWAFWRAAAAVLVLVSLPFAFYLIGLTTVVNSSDQNLAHTFPDGSSVQMAPEASLSYHRYAWHANRNLKLEGAAFFEVLAGAKFRVRVAQGSVEVKGTSFSVWADEGQMLVHCLSGNVTARSSASTVELSAGQLARCNSASPRMAAEMYKVSQPLLPQNKHTLHFENAPLSLVCAELEKALGMSVDTKLSTSLKFTGQLNSQRRDETFQVLCKTFGATLIESEGGVILMP